MEYYTFISSMVPIGGLIELVSRILWGGVSIVVAYYLGYYLMRGLGSLWGRR